MNFEMIKRNFDRGLWSMQMVQMAVTKGVITQAQADAIRQGARDPEVAELQAQLAQAEENERIITGGEQV